MKDKIGNKKTFLLATSIVILTVLFAVFAVLSSILMSIFWIPTPTDQEKLLIYIVLGFELLFIFTVYLLGGTGTATFTEDKIIFKKWLFSRRRYLLYSEINQIDIFYGYIPMGFRRAGGHCVSFFRKKRKNPVINIEITYPIIVEVLKHSEGIPIHVDYISLFKFSQKHRELLWGYLRESQKKEILKRLNKKQK